MRRRLAIPALAALAASAMAACGGDPTTGDFASEAEDFIEDDDGDLATELQNTFTEAECVEPTSTAVGTTFTCTATDASGATVEFLAEIAGETSIRVGPTGPVEPTSGTTGDTTESTATDTTGG